MSSQPDSELVDLVRAAIDGAPTARKAAIRRLVKRAPEETVPALRAELAAATAWQVYRRIATALLAVSRIHPQLADGPDDPLAPIIATARNGKRYAPLATQMLGWSGDHRVVPLLGDLALAAGVDRSCAALRALHRLEAYEAIGTLLAACKDKRSSVRGAGRLTLLAMGRVDDWGRRILSGGLDVPGTVRLIVAVFAVLRPRQDAKRWLDGEARRRQSPVQAQAAAAAQHLERERMLLQPASAPPTVDPGLLLRPAQGVPTVDPDQLLRAVDELIDGREAEPTTPDDGPRETVWTRLRRMFGGR